MPLLTDPNWAPEQVMAVIELLDDLRERIWCHLEAILIDTFQNDRVARYEVEEVSDKTKLLAPFKVAYVTHAEKHPNADKLRLCKVETDTGEIQVVCGAPNARSGIKGVIALSG